MKCAIYIDADNVSYKSVNQIMSTCKDSDIIIKKIYSDWTDVKMKRWSDKAREYGFQGIQCFGNKKKQTSDIYMITDIINDLYSNNFIEKIILATSDIDFTNLCHLIKSKNKKLVLFTPQKTSLSNLTSDEEYEEEHLHKKPRLNNEETNSKSINLINILKKPLLNNNTMIISEYKKKLKKILPKNLDIDFNHIDKELRKHPKHFSVINKGGKIKLK